MRKGKHFEHFPNFPFPKQAPSLGGERQQQESTVGTARRVRVGCVCAQTTCASTFSSVAFEAACANAMDVEPIYCAEQIQIPPNLADALKSYTKEVIRAQPEDVIEFSLNYFQKLAKLSSDLAVESVPELDMIIKVNTELGKAENPTAQDFAQACSLAGIVPELVEKVRTRADGTVRATAERARRDQLRATLGCRTLTCAQGPLTLKLMLVAGQSKRTVPAAASRA